MLLLYHIILFFTTIDGVEYEFPQLGQMKAMPWQGQRKRPRF
jgi:hypothetical protein